MLSSGHWQPDEDGAYFVDRNPKFFDMILDYMRTGKIDISDLNKKELTQLQDDLDYYQIKLPTEIQKKFHNPITNINSFKYFKYRHAKNFIFYAPSKGI